MKFTPSNDFTTDDIFSRLLEEAEQNNSQNPIDSASSKAPSMVSVKLRGDTELGYYYITLFFGTPLQRQTLIVDTGSSITAIPCTECGKNCGKNHFNLLFDTSKSETFQEFLCDEYFGKYTCSDCNGKCYYTIGYAEGSSYTGHYKKDFVVFGNEIEEYYDMLQNQTKNLEEIPDAVDHNVEDPNEQTRRVKQSQLEALVEQRKTFMPFGCTNRETKLFYEQQADGILGLGIGTNTRGSPPNLLDVFEMNNKNRSKAFSICYAPNGGYLTIGGHNTDHHIMGEQIQYASYYDEYHQYRVVLSKIEIEGTDLGLSLKTLNHGEGAFFDSGTTLTHVPKATYDAIVGGISNFCSKGGQNCGQNDETSLSRLCWRYYPEAYESVNDFFASFPTFQFYFGEDGEAKYEWKPQDYLFNQAYSRNKYCLGLSKYERETILGGTFMKNHDILFDKNNKKIAFVRADCGALNGTPGEDKKPNENPNKQPGPQQPVDPNKNGNQIPQEDPKREQLIKALILLVIGALLGGLFYAYSVMKKRAKYNDMGNNEAETAGKELRQRTDESSHVGGINGEEESPVGSKNNFPEYEV